MCCLCSGRNGEQKSLPSLQRAGRRAWGHAAAAETGALPPLMSLWPRTPGMRGFSNALEAGPNTGCPRSCRIPQGTAPVSPGSAGAGKRASPGQGPQRGAGAGDAPGVRAQPRVGATEQRRCPPRSRIPHPPHTPRPRGCRGAAAAPRGRPRGGSRGPAAEARPCPAPAPLRLVGAAGPGGAARPGPAR